MVIVLKNGTELDEKGIKQLHKVLFGDAVRGRTKQEGIQYPLMPDKLFIEIKKDEVIISDENPAPLTGLVFTFQS